MASESDYLSGERLADTIRTVQGAMRGASALQSAALDRLLRHLRALTASADGEALGFRVYLMIEWGVTECAAASVVAGWERLRGTKRREQYEQLGADLRAIGHAAGALSREGEIAALREEIERRERDRAEGVKDIDRLRGHLDLDMLASVNECADEGARLRREVERLTAELAKERDHFKRAVNLDIDASHDAAIAHEQEVATARAEGARVERRLCMADMRGEIDNADERAFAVRVADRIERRALGAASPAVTREPAPTRNDGPAIWPLLIAETSAGHYGGDTPEKRHLLEDMAERDRFGRERYGTPLQANNGRDAMIDAYQEALDLPVYLRQAQEEGRLSKYNGLVSNAVHLALCIRIHLDDADPNARGGQ